MRRIFAATSLFLLAAPAWADCKGEVLAAFEKQRKSPAFRTIATMTSPDGGKTEMTCDYLPSDKMYQKVMAPGLPAPLETIAIGDKAWATQGGGWEELQPYMAQAVTANVRQTLVEPQPESGDFACLGKQTYEGKEYTGYRSVQPPPADASQPALARTVYVDPATGLPAANVVAEEKEGAAPMFKGAYEYPADIKVEPPF